jgi:phospholipase C
MRAGAVVRAAARALVGVALWAFAGCDLPPDTRVERDGGGGTPDAGDGDDAGWPAACSTPLPADPLAAARAVCTFGAGAQVTDTLPITPAMRASIPIKHVIVMMKENRSFDHLLGALSTSGQPAAEPIPASFSNLDKNGVPVAPYHLGSTCAGGDPDHQWDAMHRQVNGGAMDGFVTNAADTTNTDGHFVMGHFEQSDLPFYYWLARTFAINDRHFPSERSGTWPNRNFLLLGTADGVRATYTTLPNAATPTIFNLLDAQGVSWGAYADQEPFDGTLGWSLSHPGVHSFDDFLRALEDGSLPSVSFVDSFEFLEDEHPISDVQVGEAWTRVVYEAAVASPLWPELALIWTYDEAGGMADHVPPPNSACVARPGNPTDTPFFELGVRVPLAVISPYARPHYVSHVVQDHTSITRFIETAFGLPALTARDANADAMLDMFDFGCAPAFIDPPSAPEPGAHGCTAMLAADQPSYRSAPTMSMGFTFAGIASPKPHDRLGLYKYDPKAPALKETNPVEPFAWGYIGGQGRQAAGAPDHGLVTLDSSSASATGTWPPGPGTWVLYYLPALADGSDGHTPSDHIIVEITP